MQQELSPYNGPTKKNTHVGDPQLDLSVHIFFLYIYIQTSTCEYFIVPGYLAPKGRISLFSRRWGLLRILALKMNKSPTLSVLSSSLILS